ncbi:MAG: twin-arginine translocase TatA/TatE family subunit [Thaumarchaeota archaeon]|nr:twin-arginine translocase TatA/TatE family subunit [Nitrososphaerota archaeon]
MALGDPLQIIVVGIIAVIIFLWGPQKIPEMARALGKARREFDSASKEMNNAMAGTVSSITTPQAGPATGDEVLVSTARTLGISTEGKTREQISQEIVARAKPQT